MKNGMLRLIGVVLIAIVLSGCSIISPVVTRQNYYDLAFNGGKKLNIPFNVVFSSFRNVSPAELNLLYFEQDGKVVPDQYNFWVQSPENMLRRFMLNAIEGNYKADGRNMDIGVVIFEFKFDTAHKKSVLGVRGNVRIHDGAVKKWEKTYVLETPVDKKDRTAYVQAMNVCAEKFVNQLVNDINKL